tara:strand:+ start:2060 stop:2512 length:453 start_codon:yes stop_codon:yes gene_type:complete
MKEKNDITKMEFLLMLNENIVVQRYFNVRGYNPIARKSIDVMDFVNEFTHDLTDILKERTNMYLLDHYNQIAVDSSILDTSNTDGEENFHVKIRLGEETICHRVFDGKLYPPKIRYTVDIRPQLKSVLRGLTEIFSSEDLTYEYMNYSLV